MSDLKTVYTYVAIRGDEVNIVEEGYVCRIGETLMTVEAQEEFVAELRTADVPAVTVVGPEMLSVRFPQDKLVTDIYSDVTDLNLENSRLVSIGKSVVLKAYDSSKMTDHVLRDLVKEKALFAWCHREGVMASAEWTGTELKYHGRAWSFVQLAEYSRTGIVVTNFFDGWIAYTPLDFCVPSLIGQPGVYSSMKWNEMLYTFLLFKKMVEDCLSDERPVYRQYWEVDNRTYEKTYQEMSFSVQSRPRPYDWFSSPRLTGNFPSSAKYRLIKQIERYSGSPLGPYLFGHAVQYVAAGGSFSLDTCQCGCKPREVLKVLALGHYWGQNLLDQAVSAMTDKKPMRSQAVHYDPVLSIRYHQLLSHKIVLPIPRTMNQAVNQSRVLAAGLYGVPAIDSIESWCTMIESVMNRVDKPRVTDWLSYVLQKCPSLLPGLWVWRDVLFHIVDGLVCFGMSPHQDQRAQMMSRLWNCWRRGDHFLGALGTEAFSLSTYPYKKPVMEPSYSLAGPIFLVDSILNKVFRLKLRHRLSLADIYDRVSASGSDLLVKTVSFEKFLSPCTGNIVIFRKGYNQDTSSIPVATIYLMQYFGLLQLENAALNRFVLRVEYQKWYGCDDWIVTKKDETKNLEQQVRDDLARAQVNKDALEEVARSWGVQKQELEEEQRRWDEEAVDA